MMRIFVFALCLLAAISAPARAQFDWWTDEERALIETHVFGGIPACADLHIRQGYVLCFDGARRVPAWVAYKVQPDFLDTPPREGRFKSFRTDPDISNEAKDSEYVGLSASRGYARGHMAPYAVMGGDRDGDGLLAEEDDDDAQTIFQANRMSNIAPQHHDGFNGSGGLWSKLERWIQDTLVEDGDQEAWVFAGTVFGAGEPEKVGPDDDIHVPPMFYKIVVAEGFSTAEPKVLAFLFPHQRIGHGAIEDFTVSIDVIEAMTGLNFLSDLDDAQENDIEDTDTWEFWIEHFQ